MVLGALSKSQLCRFLLLQDSEHEVLVFCGALDGFCDVGWGEDTREDVGEVGNACLREDNFL